MRDKEELKREILDSYYYRHATKEFDATKKISEDDFKFILEQDDCPQVHLEWSL